MEIFLTYATCREREVLDVCVRKAAPVHLTFNIIGLVAGISYICGPIILDQNLPTETVYPFATDHYPALQIIYLMQSISVLQCCTVGPLDGQVCMPFWFNIARLKLLASDMRKISGVDDLNAFFYQSHFRIIRFTQKAIKVTRPMVMTTVAMATISVVFGAVHVIGVDISPIPRIFAAKNSSPIFFSE
uniref:Or47b protein n=1 Tax=Fopius arisanus TaxID=64838 RepID=A0A0C9R364_9HYME